MRSIIIVSALLLAGCQKTPLDFKPTMASDTPLTGVEGAVLINELGRAYEPLENCLNRWSSFHESRLSPVKERLGRGKKLDDHDRCLAFKTDYDAADVSSHVRAGFALTDLYCENFFMLISERASMRRFGRSTTNDVGAAISAVLGLSGVSGALAGGVGTGFGLLDSGWRNYDESFLVHADLPALQKLVRKEQERLREDYYANGNMPDNYPDATIAILKYSNTCSFTGMRGLLTAAMLEKAEPANPNDGARIEDFVDRFIEAVEKRQAAPADSTVDDAGGGGG